MTKAQAQFLRQQRGVARHTYNLCVAHTRWANQPDVKLYLHLLVNGELEDLTEPERASVQRSIDAANGNKAALTKMFCNNAYWINSGKAWGTIAPNNLRNAAIAQFVTALGANKKKAAETGQPFSMSFLTRKDDDVCGFQIPVHKQQLRFTPVSGCTFNRPQPQPRVRRPRKPIGNGVRRRAPVENHPQRQRRIDVAIGYSGTPGDRPMTVRVREEDRFPLSKDELEQREGSVRFVQRNGMWFIVVTENKAIADARAPVTTSTEEVVREAMVDGHVGGEDVVVMMT